MRSRTEAFGFPKVKKTKGSAEKMSCEKSRGFVRRKNAPALEGGGARRHQRLGIGNVKGKKIGKGRKAAFCAPMRGDRGRYTERGDRGSYAGRES